MKIAKIITHFAAATFALTAFNSAMAQSHEHGNHVAAAVAGQEMTMSEGNPPIFRAG